LPSYRFFFLLLPSEEEELESPESSLESDESLLSDESEESEESDESDELLSFFSTGLAFAFLRCSRSATLKRREIRQL